MTQASQAGGELDDGGHCDPCWVGQPGGDGTGARQLGWRWRGGLGSLVGGSLGVCGEVKPHEAEAAVGHDEASMKASPKLAVLMAGSSLGLHRAASSKEAAIARRMSASNTSSLMAALDANRAACSSASSSSQACAAELLLPLLTGLQQHNSASERQYGSAT